MFRRYTSSNKGVSHLAPSQLPDGFPRPRVQAHSVLEGRGLSQQGAYGR